MGTQAIKQINIILVKNPVGLNEVLSLLDTEKDHYSLAALLNAHHADGIDTSWIWDGNFESLDRDKIDQVIVGGEAEGLAAAIRRLQTPVK